MLIPEENQEEQLAITQNDTRSPETTPAVVDAAVIPGETESDENVDERGVPWRNKVKELERKLNDTTQRLEELKYQQQQPAKPPVPEEDEYVKQQRELVREEATRVYNNEKYAEVEMRRIINYLQENNPRIAKIRTELELELMSNYTAAVKVSPLAIEQIAAQVMGRHIDRFIPQPKSDKKLSPIQQTLSPTPSGAPESIVLTEEERAYGKKRGFFDYGFTEAEIREEFSKEKERHKKK